QEGDHLLDLVDAGLAEDRGVRADVVAEALAFLDALDGLVPDALAVDHEVVRLSHAVDVHVDGETLVGPRLAVEAIEEDAVGAHDGVLAPLDDALDQLGDLRIDRRLAPADGDHRGAALLDRLEALRERKP